MQNQYNYNYNEASSTYSFTTKNFIIYRIAFIVDETLNSISNDITIENVYQIVIEKVDYKLEPFDCLVSKTIESIIKAFFDSVENSLIYICSNDQDKSELRFNIFDRWYKNSEYKDYIIKLDNIISYSYDGEMTKLFTSFLYHKENKHVEHALNAYKMLEEIINADK